jgi:hypothetical protein
VSEIRPPADERALEQERGNQFVRLFDALLNIEWESRRARPNATLNRINDVARSALRESAGIRLRSR